MTLFFTLFGLALAALLVSWMVGTGVLALAKVPAQEPYFSLFLRLVVGLTTLAGGYALVCTRGSTVLLGVLALLALLLWQLRSEQAHRPLGAVVPPPRLSTSYALWLVGISALIVFVGQYLLLYDTHSPYLQTPFQDYVYYSRLTLPLNRSGIETNQLEYFYPQFVTEQPYHYFETWLNALMVWVTGLPSVYVFFTSMSGVLLTVISLGFGAVFAHFGVARRWVPVLGLAFLTVTGTMWPGVERSTFLANGSLLSSLFLPLHPKVAPVYVFVLLGVLLLLQRRHVAAGAALAMLPLVFVSTTPVAAVGLGVLTIYLLIRGELRWGRALAVLLLLVASIGFMAAFYLLQPSAYDFPKTGRAFALRAIIPNAGEVRTLFNIAVGAVLNYLVYFAGYLLLVGGLLLTQKRVRELVREHSALLVWFGASLGTAAAMRAFGTHFLDSFQFFSNLMIPATAAVLAVALALALREARPKAYWLATAVVLALLVINSDKIETSNTRYSPEFLTQAAAALTKAPGPGGYLMGDADYKNPYMLSSDSYTAGNYVSNFRNDYVLVSLSEFDADSLQTDPRFSRDSAQAEQIVRKSSLYRFAKFQTMQGRHLSLDSLKYEFVRQHHLAYLCTSRQAKLPATLQPLVAQALTDSYSGESLYILRPAEQPKAGEDGRTR